MQNSTVQSIAGLTNIGSREASPLSTMVISQESSPAAFFTASPSPKPGVEYITGSMLNSAPQDTAWSPSIDYNYNTLSNFAGSDITSTRTLGHYNIGSPLPTARSDHAYRPTLTIHPTPLKSRVETQIPIKMTLFPMPPGITKLHLPTHTISKPKLLAKPPAERSPDTLELHTTLVCTSAMQNVDYRRRAFERAAALPLPDAKTRPSPEKTKQEESSPEDEDDENKPLNGGDVDICVGCITRERKRAARKKVKKLEEEESWHKDESKRIIVFNTHEMKDWQTPSLQPPNESTGNRPEPMVPDGAMQVDAPMRIACYCRHQNEKLGFHVIFTLKDYQDRVIAQEMTSSIMITDDHKTHVIPPLSTQTSNGSDTAHHNGAGGGDPSSSTFDLSSGSIGNMAPFRMSHSSSDLQHLQQQIPLQQPANPSANHLISPHASQNPSAAMTPRIASRQASPSAASGPNAKKRKASGSSKVPSGLAMTRLETGQATTNTPTTTSLSTNATAPPTMTPYTPGMSTFHTPTEHQFGLPPMTANGQLFNTGPPTPNSNDHVFFSTGNGTRSFDNNSLQHLYSAPASAHPSRAPSPNGLRNSVQVYQQQQAQVAQAFANGMFGMPLSLNSHRLPTIHKMIPAEGPKAGGIEVTCLGSGFCQGLEVMFGDTKATTTTFWGETSLVCLLPPAAFAGLVPVTFKHQHQQTYPAPPIPKQHTSFKYIDDDEQQIIRTALSVLGHKMTGKMEDVRDLARRIVGDGPSSWSGAPTGQSPPAGTQHASGFNAASFGVDTEATLLRCLDLIDLDDSPNMPRWNLRRTSGQTMLHLACSLGLHRFVAGLLARGANPEPRDKGGFTPMHFAALHGHPQIVRRLILSGADPTMRSLQGYTPADLATSDEVLRSTRRVEHHSRTRSSGSMRRRTSSATSLRSLWQPPAVEQPPSASTDTFDYTDSSDDGKDEFEDDDADVDTPANEGFWLRARPRNTQAVGSKAPAEQTSHRSVTAVSAGAGIASPSAAMTAFRDQLSAQIHHLQQTMHLNLPNLPQMPALPMMPNLPDYQAYLPTAPMVRRISSMVPHMGVARPGSGDSTNRETDYKWWDLFSSAATVPPPAYEDIFPHGDVDTKRSSATQAATDAVADNKCAAIFDQTETVAGSSSVAAKQDLLEPVRIGRKHVVSKEQQEHLRLIHVAKVKRLKNDRALFFIWVSYYLSMSNFVISGTKLMHYRYRFLSLSFLPCCIIAFRRFGQRPRILLPISTVGTMAA